MIIKFGPFTFAIAHTHMPWRMIGFKLTAAIRRGIFQHDASIMIFGTGLAWTVDREPSSPIEIGFSLVLASIPATIGLRIGQYDTKARESGLATLLGDILAGNGIDPCVFDEDGACTTHQGGVLVNPTDTQLPKGY